MEHQVHIDHILLKSIPLQNGLLLEAWDNSRVITGDRWNVSVIAKVDIPVKKVLLNQNEKDSTNVVEIIQLLGENICFEKKMERLFVDEKEKDIIIQDTLNSLIESIFPYLNHPLFCKKFVMNEFMKARKSRKYNYL